MEHPATSAHKEPERLDADAVLVRKQLRHFRSLNPELAAEIFQDCLPPIFRHGDDSLCAG